MRRAEHRKQAGEQTDGDEQDGWNEETRGIVPAHAEQQRGDQAGERPR